MDDLDNNKSLSFNVRNGTGMTESILKSFYLCHPSFNPFKETAVKTNRFRTCGGLNLAGDKYNNSLDLGNGTRESPY